jgi:hypothetical protein
MLDSGASAIHPTTGSPVFVRKYSDTLLMMLLKANGPTRQKHARAPTADAIAEIAHDPDPPRVARGRVD